MGSIYKTFADNYLIAFSEHMFTTTKAHISPVSAIY